MANELTAAVQLSAGVAVIDLKGEINAFAEGAMNAAYAQAMQSKPSSIMLNFHSVDYINSTGIALIVSLMAQARKSGVKFMATGLSAHYLEIFKITRLVDFMTIVPDAASVMAKT